MNSTDAAAVAALRDIAESLREIRKAVAPVTPSGMEAVTIQTPDGERLMFIDEHGESRWLRQAAVMGVGVPAGWRQVWVVTS